MIISASRRTDIPAFYTPWLIERLRQGICTVPNPFNPGQVATISLRPEDVDAIVFWTRNPRPLFPYLAELDARGYRYYFQYTLMDNPRLIDPHSPSAGVAARTFRELAERIGPERLVWRYDPIVFTTITDVDYHRLAYERLARELCGDTQRSVISLLDVYAKAKKRLEAMGEQGAGLLPFEGIPDWLGEMLCNLVAMAGANGMQVYSCAEEHDLQPFGVLPGRCVDDTLIRDVFGLEVCHTKDPGQRKACGCVVSKDIGMYDTCLFGCRYCYATSSFEKARGNYVRHRRESSLLVKI
jgi:hypothetical protein